MKITRSTTSNGNIYPEAYDYLRSLPNVALHHTEHDNLRHPLAIYNMSLKRVVNAFSTVLDENDKLSEINRNEDEEPLPTISFPTLVMAQTELLESLLAHIDDCYQILMALYSPVIPKKPGEFAEQWLTRAKHPTVSNFKHLVKSYRDSFAPIVNRIKHEHGRIRGIWMYNPNEYISGYFLENVDKNGIVGPDLKFHNGNKAISLNRDLRYHFTHLYETDHFFAEAIVKAISKTYDFTFPTPMRVEEKSENIEQAAERIHKLPFLFFPDEVGKPTPTVLFHKENGEAELSLNTMSIIHAPNVTKMRVIVAYEGDGVTREWRVPYPDFASDLRGNLVGVNARVFNPKTDT
jgi:hypothetical protein